MRIGASANAGPAMTQSAAVVRLTRRRTRLKPWARALPTAASEGATMQRWVVANKGDEGLGIECLQGYCCLAIRLQDLLLTNRFAVYRGFSPFANGFVLGKLPRSRIGDRR